MHAHSRETLLVALLSTPPRLYTAHEHVLEFEQRTRTRTAIYRHNLPPHPSSRHRPDQLPPHSHQRPTTYACALHPLTHTLASMVRVSLGCRRRSNTHRDDASADPSERASTNASSTCPPSPSCETRSESSMSACSTASPASEPTKPCEVDDFPSMVLRTCPREFHSQCDDAVRTAGAHNHHRRIRQALRKRPNLSLSGTARRVRVEDVEGAAVTGHPVSEDDQNVSPTPGVHHVRTLLRKYQTLEQARAPDAVAAEAAYLEQELESATSMLRAEIQALYSPGSPLSVAADELLSRADLVLHLLRSRAPRAPPTERVPYHDGMAGYHAVSWNGSVTDESTQNAHTHGNTVQYAVPPASALTETELAHFATVHRTYASAIGAADPSTSQLLAPPDCDLACAVSTESSCSRASAAHLPPQHQPWDVSAQAAPACAPYPGFRLATSGHLGFDPGYNAPVAHDANVPAAFAGLAHAPYAVASPIESPPCAAAHPYACAPPS